MQSDFQYTSETYLKRLNAFLDVYLQNTKTPAERIHQALAYTVLAGGKRIRPLLVYHTASLFNTDLIVLDHAAAAVELIHCYSLIHDDLPCMDDDVLRRGQPTCHIAFDEATAVLAGDALQAMAFEILAQTPVPAYLSLQDFQTMMAQFAYAVGVCGMVGGQSLDMLAEGQRITINQLEQIHRYKTGALIEAAVMLGAILSDSSDYEKSALHQYAKAIGLAFQVQDDILDVTADTKTLGKTQGADIAADKNTYVALLGLDAARLKLQQLFEEAMDAIQTIDRETYPLAQIAHLIIKRIK